MKKVLCSIALFLFFGSMVIAQEGKNLVYGEFATLSGDVSFGGRFSGKGYSLGYSRYILDRLYGDFNIGSYNYNGEGDDNYFLEKEEEEFWNMNQWSLGFGYDLIKENKITVSGELSLLVLSNIVVTELWTTDDRVTLRTTGRYKDETLLANIKGRYHISDHWMGMATFGYGFGMQRYQSTHLKVGIGYLF